MKTFITFLLFIAGVLGALCWATTARASVTNWPAYQYLMVDQNGMISPAGYAAGLTEIAQFEAQAASVAQATALQADATAAASNVVDAVVAALTGAYGFCYVTGYTVSFSGAVQVSTNASAQIALLQFGVAGSTNILGVAHTGHYLWHVYSEAMNATPAIKYHTNLNATNAWQVAEYQSTTSFNNTTVNGTLYETIYRSTVWMPSAYDSAFFMAFCEILGGGVAGGMFDIQTGFSIGGKVGFTGDVVENGYRKTFQCGALMSITNEVAQ